MLDMSLRGPQFTHRNEPFTCEACGQKVPPLDAGCRNHCPFCLSSKHVDNWPGDRASTCGGMMEATAYEVQGGFSVTLTHRCRKCSKIIKNKASLNDKNAADSLARIVAIQGRQINFSSPAKS